MSWTRRPLLSVLILVQFLMVGMVLAPNKVSAAEGIYCAESVPNIPGVPGYIFGFPTWYKYLNPQPVDATATAPASCRLDSIRDAQHDLDPTYLVRIGLAIFEILMRIAGIATLVFVMYGAFQFLTSQGEPDKYAAARTTLTNALIGLAIVLSAVAIVNLIGGNIT